MHRVLKILSLLLLAVPVRGQLTEDFGSWVTLNYNTDITNDLGFSVDQEFRFGDNSIELQRYFTNLGLTYKLNRNFRIAGIYRWTNNKRPIELWGRRHRIMGDVIYRTFIPRFRFIYRHRIQWEVRGYGYINEISHIPSWHSRSTFKVNYFLNRKFEPYLSVDLRFILHNPRIPFYSGFDRHRIKGGVEVKISRNQSLGLYFMTGQHWNIPEPERLYIIGLEYSFGRSLPLLGS